MAVLGASSLQIDSATLGSQTGSAPMFACRAWVNFNGTTAPGTIRGNGNVTSVARNGTGDYTVTFTTAMPDANYSFANSLRNEPAPGSGANASCVSSFSNAPTASALRVVTGPPSSGTTANYSTISVTIFR
jgi:hypothetical protein